MTGRHEQITEALIDAIAIALTEGATWSEPRAVRPCKHDLEFRVEEVRLDTPCVECGVLCCGDEKDGRHGVPPHDAVPDDEAAGIVVIGRWFTRHDLSGAVRLTTSDRLAEQLGIAGLCEILDALVRPPELTDLGLGWFLAFGEKE